MVFVNSRKYACASCIKGHRSSACHHVDRPLFEVRRKGRPVTQCSSCRDARKNNKFHGRCSCSCESENSPSACGKTAFSRGSTTKPIPAFPNGIRDLLDSMDTIPLRDAHPKQTVKALLNPCACTDPYHCTCSQNTTSPGASTPKIASCCNAKGKGNERNPSFPSPVPPTPKSISRGPDLPPILGDPTAEAFKAASTLSIPKLHTISSIAGTGCTCGIYCECPGCPEHNSVSESQTASTSHLANSCGACVDYAGEITLGSDLVDLHTECITSFFAMAASLPPPPPSYSRTLIPTARLDAFNLRVFPPAALVVAKDNQDVRSAFGLVEVPKLQCCAGKCTCNPDDCGCGDKCGGCCVEENPSPRTASVSCCRT